MEKVKKKTVLLIDDEKGWLSTMKTILQRNNITVITAEGGEEAILKLEQKKLDLILCDVRMPTMNGYDVFMKTKELPKVSSIPFVFMSNFDDFDAKNVAKQIGADDYVSKPTSIEEANSVVTELLSRFGKPVKPTKK